jgi:hypothetical protein
MYIKCLTQFAILMMICFSFETSSKLKKKQLQQQRLCYLDDHFCWGKKNWCKSRQDVMFGINMDAVSIVCDADAKYNDHPSDFPTSEGFCTNCPNPTDANPKCVYYPNKGYYSCPDGKGQDSNCKWKDGNFYFPSGLRCSRCCDA